MMNEQRFTKECGNNGMTCRIWDNGLPMTTDEVVNKLNEQQATISQLQDLCGESDGENAKLRIENKKLKEMNEQLRQTMQKVCELLEEEVDLFSDEATEHDIIAYSEMQDFDNKDAYYICTTTKKAIQMLKR